MKLKEHVVLFNALADGTRLRILNLLTEGELCVCDLMRILREPQSKISRHLAYLRRSGLVRARKSGLWMHYRLSDPGGSAKAVLKALADGSKECDECRRDLAGLRGRKGRSAGCST